VISAQEAVLPEGTWSPGEVVRSIAGGQLGDEQLRSQQDGQLRC